MRQFFPISGEASTIANAIATAISKELTIEGQNIWGNLLVLVGSSMLSIAAINESLSNKCGTTATADNTANASDAKSG